MSTKTTSEEDKQKLRNASRGRLLKKEEARSSRVTRTHFQPGVGKLETCTACNHKLCGKKTSYNEEQYDVICRSGNGPYSVGACCSCDAHLFVMPT